MRLELLYNVRLMCERLAAESNKRRRLAKLRRTPAQSLSLGHIDSLELLELAQRLTISVIYDVGANVGTWCLLAKAIFPQANIHAFEPLPKHHDQFLINMTHVTDVELHRVALGSENEAAVLHETDFSDASSMLELSEAGKKQWGIQEVEQLPIQLRRLDDYRAANDLPWPDLIKLDVQGLELEVLKGARRCIETAKAVISEVSFVEYYRGQCLFHELVNHMAEAGLFISGFGCSTPVGVPIGQTDVLFARQPTDLAAHINST